MLFYFSLIIRDRLFTDIYRFLLSFSVFEIGTSENHSHPCRINYHAAQVIGVFRFDQVSFPILNRHVYHNS